MSGRYLGLDTSNYRTSAAFFEDADHWRNEGRLLSVPQGERGLRQSDAVFQHVKALHGQIAKLGAIGPLRAVAASVTPRTEPGSYMPCFLVGETVGRSVASLSGLPFYAVSHQQGHVAAAAFSAGVLSWLRQPFYVWHVSGGTTELLLAEPDGAAGPRLTIVGGSQDLAAGQLVDRTGVLLGAAFPAGEQVERWAAACDHPLPPARPKCRDGSFSLSGVENQVQRHRQNGASAEQLARFVMDTLANALTRATEQVLSQRPLPLLCAGGVMANRTLADGMRRRFGAAMAAPALSGDNALGAALLAKIREEGLDAV